MTTEYSVNSHNIFPFLHFRKRCDNSIDCLDTSDELECSIIEKNPTYSKKLTPTQGTQHTGLLFEDFKCRRVMGWTGLL